MKNVRNQFEKLTPSKNEMQGVDVDSLKNSFINHLEYSLGKDFYSATNHDLYASLSLAARDRLTERWLETQQTYYNTFAKRVYYLSLEFLMGRALGNNLINLNIYGAAGEAAKLLGYDLENFREIEWDAGLGNGGLGRLAACFLDSLATLEYPAIGYGIRYDYGIFFQSIVNGYQVESADNWLRLGNFWEFPRPELQYPIHFYGEVQEYVDDSGKTKYRWINTDTILAMAYDTPVPGYGTNTVNHLRLWSAKATTEFNLEYFNEGDYKKAVLDKSSSENVSKVLYPNDNIFEGKELRLKQEYFFVSATIQDILAKHKKMFPDNIKNFADMAAIQLNDTHPAIGIPELMRILIDIKDLDWDTAWDITTKTFAYTNHTILPEALEKWSVPLMEKVLPRHLQIIYQINDKFLKSVSTGGPSDYHKMQNISIIEEGEVKRVRMANLAIVGSHSINGVAALHSEILKDSLFNEFYKIWPEKFNNKTNGITQRRWLLLCNPDLADLITQTIGDKWATDLYELKKLIPFADDKDFQDKWMAVKQDNKNKFVEYIKARNNLDIDAKSLFDVQVKRMHEYKRQLLNLLHAIHLYNKIKDNPKADHMPRTIVFSGKAAPGYYMAKLIIKLINSVAAIVNEDKDVGEKLKIVFLRNYAVSNAEKIIPAADLSEQISTAGTEASGTGNMKFALNGALTIGTLDGANIEILEEVGDENIFIFGMNTEEVHKLKSDGYNPMAFYESNPDLKRIVDQIWNGYFSPEQTDLFRPIMQSLLYQGDHYCVLADFKSYADKQAEISKAFTDKRKWAKMSILNTANMGKFSSDRTIHEYAKDIWGVKPVKVGLNNPCTNSK